MKNIVFADMNGGFIFLIVLACFAAIGGIGYLIYRLFIKKKKGVKEEPPSEEKVAEENLKNVLQEVDDEKTKEEFEKYEKENKDKDEDK